MALVTPLTKDQWYEKLRSFVPNWYFENELSQEAHARGLAALLAALEEDIADHVNQTFISNSVGDFLTEHGNERSVTKIEGEFDAQYRERVRNIKNESNCPDIRSTVDSLLMVGVSDVREDYQGNAFVSREEFVNRGTIILEEIVNAFSILVDQQIHEPYSFADREYFSDRDEFVGTSVSSDYVFNLILQAINDNKALGVSYRILERLGV